MNASVLIDAIVRQTTVLIAQLATTGGVRAPLARLANQVFLDLARELESQGVSRKVSADMFGMALRAYLNKIQRLRESSTDRGKSLWEAVYGYLRSQDFVTRAALARRFASDDETLVRGVVHDLVESGLVLATGSGVDGVLRAATDEELGRMRALDDDRVDELIWAIVFCDGPASREQLERIESVATADLDAALERLVAAGRIVVDSHLDVPRYRAHSLVLSLGSTSGWEAAVFDHFHAMVSTVTRKLALGRGAALHDVTGGSTYTFEVWPGHPLEEEVRGVLARFRAGHTDLRARLLSENERLSRPPTAYRVVVYGGQYVEEAEES